MRLNYLSDFGLESLVKKLPEIKEKRIVELIKIYTQLSAIYGQRYREINNILSRLENGKNMELIQILLLQTRKIYLKRFLKFEQIQYYSSKLLFQELNS